MKTLAFLLTIILSTGYASAQAVKVQSGDHDGFTRLVLEFGAPVEWTFGRTSDGYALHLPSSTQPYDLSAVYKLIQHDRLSAIWVDPETGNLHLGIGCPCYAMPFEFRPGVIVIDLRDGPPPKGSSFEQALDGTAQPELAAKALPHPQPRPSAKPDLSYDWLTASRSPDPAPKEIAVPLQNPDLLPMRDSILRQMSDGAARGTVEMAIPQGHKISESPTGPLRQIRIGEDIGFNPDTLTHPQSLTESGADCITDERLDMSSWGNDTPVAEQMAPATFGLMGEFDQPDPIAVKRAVQFYLYLGFGAEAAQLLKQMPTDDPDKDIWQTMARILDSRDGEAGPFQSMQSCDTAAALWAVLAQPEKGISGKPHLAAILRSFSGLPLHLRRHIGPILSEKFMAQGDTATVRAIRDAILRAPGDPGPDVRLMTAELAVASGDAESASKDLHALSQETGPTATKALVSYIDTLVKERKSADPNMATTLAAHLLENRGTALEAELQRARVLAIALGGDFDAAFTEVAQVPEAQATLWELLADLGSDDAVLTHAIAPDPKAPLAARRILAKRLNTFGLPDPALKWLPDIFADVAAASDDDRLLAAEIALRRHDAQTTLRLAAGLSGAEAATLRAKAQTQLGDLAAATGLFDALGDSASALQAARKAQEWQTVSENAEGAWQDAAALLAPTTPDIADAEAEGPLARTKRLLERSAADRATLASLLQDVPTEVRAEPATP